MPARAASPALSEAELDISSSIYTGRDSAPKAGDDGFDFDDILNRGANRDDGDDGDAAFIALQQAASYRKSSNLKGRTVKKGGGFQAMGLNAHLLKAITKKGFAVPTPIQRKTIPLLLDRRDVVGMARTGSGKTAAFVIPMIEKLRAHSARFGARALILSPSRELAIQTLKVVNEFGKGTDLKSVLLVGGDSLEEQFGLVSANPDIVIATPGRFLHLKVEMNLDLSSVKYVVFDEADRLFEMGFQAQLTEILYSLPASRQTMLFSATLPSSLVEFARAGLQDPSLVRLDAETKISPDLQSAFFSTKGAEKEASLLHIIHDVIKVPMGLPEAAIKEKEKNSKKRKWAENAGGKPTEHSTIVFTATKHHVEYLANLLQEAGFAVSYVYGSLDQMARRIQVEDFRRGITNILVVTDVAARGIDIPILANVINYDFPSQPKVFVHRVGRTARAGKSGWSYSLVREIDAPYLVDLQLFLGKKLVVGQDGEAANYSEDVAVGALKRDSVEVHMEWLNKLMEESTDISSLRVVAGKAEKLYLKTRNSASSQSARRSKELVSSRPWGQLHQVFGQDAARDQQARADMLARISGFKPQETIFEVGQGDKHTTEAVEAMKSLRQRVAPHRKRGAVQAAALPAVDDSDEDMEGITINDDDDDDGDIADDMADDNDSDLEVTVTNTDNQKGRTNWQDTDVFMSYTPRTINAAEERGYGVHSGGAGSSFVEAARDVAMDLTNDDNAKSFAATTQQKMRWDPKSKNYVARINDEDGSRGAKMIRGESGVKIAASFKSGRFDKWKKAHRVSKLPRVGEAEAPNSRGRGNTLGGGARYKHKQEQAPKEADKYRDDFEVRKKRVAEAREKRVGRFKDGMGSKREVKGREDIKKARREVERKKAKNARGPPNKRGGKR